MAYLYLITLISTKHTRNGEIFRCWRERAVKHLLIRQYFTDINLTKASLYVNPHKIKNQTNLTKNTASPKLKKQDNSKH